MNLHMIWLQNNKLFNEVNDSQFSDCTYVVDIDLVHNINWIYIYIMYCMHNIKHIQIFALNWHITQYACECRYIHTYTLRPVLFSIWHCLQNNMFITNFCLHPGPFNCLRPPGLPASAESIHWALWQHAHVWLAQDFADWFGALGVGNGNLNQTWLIFENRNAGMNWDTSMITDVYGIERCHCSSSLVKKLFETTWDVTIFHNSTRWPTWKC